MVLFEAVELDFENSLLYSITFENAGVRIRKLRIPVFSIGLNEKLDDSTYTVLEDEVLTPETLSSWEAIPSTGSSWTGRDGYWYGFSNEGNSSGGRPDALDQNLPNGLFLHGRAVDAVQRKTDGCGYPGF